MKGDSTGVHGTTDVSVGEVRRRVPIPGGRIVVTSITDSIDRPPSFALVLAAGFIVALWSLSWLEGSARSHGDATAVALHAATPAMRGQSPPADTPSTPVPFPVCGVAEVLEDEVECGGPSALRFSAACRPQKRSIEGGSGHGLGRLEAVFALLARAADYGRLCRRLL